MFMHIFSFHFLLINLNFSTEKLEKDNKSAWLVFFFSEKRVAWLLPNHRQQTGWQELDFVGLFFSSGHRYQDMQVQSSRALEVPLMQLNNWKFREEPELFSQENMKINFKPIEKMGKMKKKLNFFLWGEGVPNIYANFNH